MGLVDFILVLNAGMASGGTNNDDGLWHDESYFPDDDGLWHDASYFSEDDGLWHDETYF